MTDATAYETDPNKLVDQAAGWALDLWRVVHRGLGDTQERSMHEAARLARVTPNTIWKLRYRRPREIGASVYFKLKVAHERHVVSLEAQLAEKLAVLRSLPTTSSRARLVAELESYLGHPMGDFDGPIGFEPEDEDQTQGWGT